MNDKGASNPASNPGFMDDPWKEGEKCLAAVLGKDGLLIRSGDWGAGGFLHLAPRKREKLPWDHFQGQDTHAAFNSARIQGPGILIIFPTPEDARNVGQLLTSLADLMDAKMKAGGSEDAKK